jgi:nucleoside 2-deoxyribosyltransferase
LSGQPSESAPKGTTEILVVGGTYRETCLEPTVDALRGSGLRAAAILASLGRRCSFTTLVDEASAGEAAAMSHDLGFVMTSGPRTTPVTFSYDTPISTAQWNYGGDREKLEVTGSTVVAFGMVDADWNITADRLVIDPQHGDPAEMLRAATVAEAVAVVLNSHEAYRITGLPPREAGIRLLRGADVVIIKQGALGGMIFHGAAMETYGPIPTKVTRTIGSGDAFAAGFAHAWFENPGDPLAAALFGARTAAAHSLTDVPQIPQDLLDSLPAPLNYPLDQTPRIYVAAPFFTTAERLLLETVRTALFDAGLDVFSPLHDVGAGGDDVALRDLQGLEACDAVLALLDGSDPGTVFETGWAIHADIPVVGFTAQPELHDWTMLRGTGAELSSDLTSAVHLAAWAAIRRASGQGVGSA